MKICHGFVSNSSSSSFILAVKSSVKSEAIEDAVFRAMKIQDDSPLKSYVTEMACILRDNAEEMDMEEISDLYGGMKDTAKEAFKKGMRVFQGSVASDGEMVEQLLCDLGFEIKNDDFILVKEGGY